MVILATVVRGSMEAAPRSGCAFIVGWRRRGKHFVRDSAGSRGRDWGVEQASGVKTGRPAVTERRQEPECPVFAQRLVEVAALGALHAARTAGFAGAFGDQGAGVGDEALESLVGALREADAAGVAVVDEDRRLVGLPVPGGGETADVPAVAHGVERQDGDERVLGGVQRAGHKALLFRTLGCVLLDEASIRGGASVNHRASVVNTCSGRSRLTVSSTRLSVRSRFW